MALYKYLQIIIIIYSTDVKKTFFIKKYKNMFYVFFNF